MRYLSLIFVALLSLVVLPSTGSAKALILVTSITTQCPGPTITITLNPQTVGAWLPGLYVHFDPSASAPPPGTPGTAWGNSLQGWTTGNNSNPGTDNLAAASTAGFITLTTGVHALQITDNASSTIAGAASAIDPFNVPSCTPSKMGMTWIHTASNAQTGTITVGCSGCSPTSGDTVCTTALPLLCIYKPTPGFPLPTGVSSADQYTLWSGGVVATTTPVPGSQFAHLSDADKYCRVQANLGPNWRAAEFHDGWGWNFQAYGGTVSAPAVPSTRFWVNIKDQPNGNCWAQ